MPWSRAVSASMYRVSFLLASIAGKLLFWARETQGDLQSFAEIYETIKQLKAKSIRFTVSLIFRLYCYAQKHVRSIRAVTRTGHDESQQRIPPQCRRYGGKKKFIKRSPHQLAAYNTSDRKAAVTVGVIMGVFLGECFLRWDRWLAITLEWIVGSVRELWLTDCHRFESEAFFNRKLKPRGVSLPPTRFRLIKYFQWRREVN